jgi:hypothetical protein
MILGDAESEKKNGRKSDPAGNDPLALKKGFGKDLILEVGINNQPLLGGKESIEKEIISKSPFL